MGARYYPIGGVDSNVGQPLLVPIGVGDGRPQVSVSVEINDLPTGAPDKGKRATLTLSIPTGSLIAYLTVEALDTLEDQLLAARKDLVAALAGEASHG